MKLRILALGVIALTAACKSPSSSSSSVPQSLAVNTSSSTDGNGIYWAFSPSTDLTSERKVALSVTIPATRKVFYLFTNTSTSSSYSPLLSGVLGSQTAKSLNTTAPMLPWHTSHDKRRYLSDLLPATTKLPSRSLARAALSYTAYGTSYGFTVGQQKDFIDALWVGVTSTPQAANTHPSTLRAQIVTTDNKHTLSVWVANDCWKSTTGAGAPDVPNSTNPITHGVTQAMVDALAAKFLNSGNDIYTYDTTILGEEWPATGQPTYQSSSMVDSEGNIHIFIANLNPSGTDDGIMLGYFHALNNYVGATGSNQKILFAIDADSLGNPSDDGTETSSGWAVTDYWPSEIMSTLAHEFQHMIQFYQKQVRQGLGATDTWVNEMASMMTEDIVSEKLGVMGPRGVPLNGNNYDYSTGTAGNENGRLPEYNADHMVIPLTGWGNGYNTGAQTLDSYANAYAFGAWLLRNYGGSTLLHDLATNAYTDYNAVIHAVNTSAAGSGQTYDSLVRDWGLATFLESSSIRAGLKYHAASGDDSANGQADSNRFSWNYGTTPVTYQLGSIDLGKYRTTFSDGTQPLNGPAIYNGFFSSIGLYAGATHIYYAGTQTAGTSTKTIDLPKNVALTVVTTP